MAPKDGLHLASLVIVVVTAPVTPAVAATPFVHETVDATDYVGLSTSLALDVYGNPHISYVDSTNGTVEYAVKIGGAWTVETVDAIGLGFGFWGTSIALDAEGTPHISYYGETNSDLRYAVKNGSSWTVEAVDATGVVGLNSSIALDADGDPHISYYDATNGDLKYAVRDGSWTLEVVDAAGIVGEYSSIAVDAQGRPHISYNDKTNSYLKYAVRNGGVWMLETVDATSQVTLNNSIALDAQGNPHIGYFDNTNEDLLYAAKIGGSWTIETVDTAGSAGWYASLVLDAQGNPRVGYLAAFPDVDLRYAVKDGGMWQIETVDATGFVGAFASLALDAHGNPSISYLDSDNGDLRYTDAAVHLTSPVGGERWLADDEALVTWDGAGAVDVMLSLDGGTTYTTLASSVTGGQAVVAVPNQVSESARVKVVRASPFSSSQSTGVFAILDFASPWWGTTVETTGDVGWYSSLALDAEGNPHISYWNFTPGDLDYAVKRGGTWVLETVDATGDVGSWTSLALDAGDNPHVSYHDETNGDLKYAVKTGSWAVETVDATGDVGWHTSLALDVQGNPHIAYLNATDGDLKYAVKNGGWMIETVHATGDIGWYPSLALDTGGNPHVSYYDATNGALRYAVKDGSWTLELVDDMGVVGEYSSLALDSDGNPHVSYYDQTNGNLKYAVKNGSWTIETVDVTDDVGWHTSLALDVLGNPHISYLDLTNGGLEYAVKNSGAWFLETAATGAVGVFSSLALDAHGNPHMSHYNLFEGDLEYTSAAIEVADPPGGDTWPVGGTRTITWEGVGSVDVSLSVDGGSSYQPLASGVTGGAYPLVVPHTPSKFCRVKVERDLLHSVSFNDSLFTIETSVSLLSFLFTPASEGVTISWATDPGPEDLAGYILEKRIANAWSTIVSLTKETSHYDPEGTEGDRYRLFSQNNLGERLQLGEASYGEAPRVAAPLAAWPNPFQSGELTIVFGTASGVGGGTTRTDVAIYDIAGRLVRRVAGGEYGAGVQTVTWDGRNAQGERAATGVYFVRSRTLGTTHTQKLVIIR